MKTELVLSESAQRQIAAVAADLGAKVKAIAQADLTAEVARMQTAAGDAQNLEAAAKATTASLERQIADLRATVGKVQGEARAAEDWRDALLLELGTLEPKVRDLRAEYDGHKRRVEAV
jgi:chromosome segregation ATPase